jgi:RNA recognition motif-containing protein
MRQTKRELLQCFLQDSTDYCSLYLTNLPSSKIQKPDLRLLLYSLFSTYGPVLDVVALKTQKMRGQAHIVFRDVQTATQAMRALQGFEFLGMPLVRIETMVTCYTELLMVLTAN